MNGELFRTTIDIPRLPFCIEPGQHILCVGSCFAQAIGQHFADALFPTTINPWGVMYNPVSILHTIEKLSVQDADAADRQPSSTPPDVAILTLGTNHVYRLKSTGEVVDNCQKRPSTLFREECLTVDECAESLRRCVELLCRWNANVRIVVTVSPIRYRKYGFHGSQLSKATLLLATERLHHLLASPRDGQEMPDNVAYFPAYELMNDELRDYRFYAPDMLHPSEVAVDYIWKRFVEAAFSTAARQYLAEWRPIRQALHHRPFNPESAEYQQFLSETQQRLRAFKEKYGLGA